LKTSLFGINNCPPIFSSLENIFVLGIILEKYRFRIKSLLLCPAQLVQTFLLPVIAKVINSSVLSFIFVLCTVQEIDSSIHLINPKEQLKDYTVFTGYHY
jgi:hypothetical protein